MNKNLHTQKMREEQILSKHSTLNGNDRAISRDKQGRFYTYLPNRKQIRRSSYEKLLDALEEYYNDVELKIAESKSIKTFAMASIEEEYLKNIISPETYKRKLSDIKRMFEGNESYKNTILEKSMDKLDANDIEEYCIFLIQEQGLSFKAFKNCKTILKGAFKYGRKHGIIETDYQTLFDELPSFSRFLTKRNKSVEEEVFSPTEIIQIMDHLKDFHFEGSRKQTLLDFAVFLIGLFGLRPGEVVALQYKDFLFKYAEKASHKKLLLFANNKYPSPYLVCDEESETGAAEIGVMFFFQGDYSSELKSPAFCELSVTKSEKGGEIVNSTKTGNNRKIKASDPYLDRYFFWEVLNDDSDPEDFIFRSKGNVIYSKDISKHLKEICRNLHIPVRSATALRKAFCMRLVSQGATDAEIISYMGHVDINTSRNNYMKLYETEDYKYKRARKLSSFSRHP